MSEFGLRYGILLKTMDRVVADHMLKLMDAQIESEDDDGPGARSGK